MPPVFRGFSSDADAESTKNSESCDHSPSSSHARAESDVILADCHHGANVPEARADRTHFSVPDLVTTFRMHKLSDQVGLIFQARKISMLDAIQHSEEDEETGAALFDAGLCIFVIVQTFNIFPGDFGADEEASCLELCRPDVAPDGEHRALDEILQSEI